MLTTWPTTTMTLLHLHQTVKGENGKLQPYAGKGSLPAHVTEPLFVTDPNHRNQVLTGEL